MLNNPALRWSWRTPFVGRQTADQRRKRLFKPVLDRLEERSLLDAGALDPTFGTGGKVMADFRGIREVNATALARQPDGKLLVAGVTTDSASSRDLVLARYHATGSFDTTFGVGGIILSRGASREARAALAVQADGKIVVASSVMSASSEDVFLTRYHGDGSLDVTFGTGGKVVTDFGAEDRAAGLALQPDGKLVVVGFSKGASIIVSPAAEQKYRLSWDWPNTA